jgi:hypothetical protein
MEDVLARAQVPRTQFLPNLMAGPRAAVRCPCKVEPTSEKPGQTPDMTCARAFFVFVEKGG